MPRLLNHLLNESALRHPDAVAVRCRGESLSYGELARRAHGLASLLLELGMKKGDRVAVLLGKSFEVPTAFYGVFAAGGILVPIDPKSPTEQILRILRATGTSLLITEPGKRKAVLEVLAAYPEIRCIVGLEPENFSPEGPAAKVSCQSVPWSTVFEESKDRPPAVHLIDLDPAYVLHTSGSTGTPKLIQHTHSSAMSFVEWAVAEYALTQEDRLTNHSSHHTCFATFDYYAAAAAGATTVLLTPEVLMMTGSLSALLEEERITVWYSVPTALVQLSLRGALAKRDLQALRWVLFAGETFPEKHLQRILQQLPDARFSHVYGSTEVNVCTYYHLPESNLESGPLPIGRACSTAATRVMNHDGQPVERGEMGELWVRGSTVMSGYWGDPDRNAQVFTRQPSNGGLDEVYFRTGDQVRELEDGNLTFVARADLQIKVRGFRVELEEVENALLSLEPVEEAAVVALPDGEGSSTLRAAVVVDPESSYPAGSTGQQQIMGALRRILPIHAIPAEILTLEALPRTPTGKVDRNALRTSWKP